MADTWISEEERKRLKREKEGLLATALEGDKVKNTLQNLLGKGRKEQMAADEEVMQAAEAAGDLDAMHSMADTQTRSIPFKQGSDRGPGTSAITGGARQDYSDVLTRQEGGVLPRGPRPGFSEETITKDELREDAVGRARAKEEEESKLLDERREMRKMENITGQGVSDQLYGQGGDDQTLNPQRFAVEKDEGGGGLMNLEGPRESDEGFSQAEFERNVQSGREAAGFTDPSQAPSDEQIRDAGRSGTGIPSPEDYDRRRSGAGQLEQTERQAAEGIMQDTLDREAAGGVDFAEGTPEVEEMKDLSKKAAAGDKQAIQDRKEMFSGMDKETKANAKESLGNYMVDPNSGYAINMDTIEASADRASKFAMLQHVPVHARAQMMASWGFIDQEDVDNMPEDPRITVEQVKADGNLAVQKAAESGDLNVAKVMTNSQKEITKMNNGVKKELQLNDIQYNKLKDSMTDSLARDGLSLKEWMAEQQFDLQGAELDIMQDKFQSEIDFKYDNMDGVQQHQKKLLEARSAEFNKNWNLKSDAEKRQQAVANYTMSMNAVKTYMENGQFESAMLASPPGQPLKMNPKNFWRARTKSTLKNPTFAHLKNNESYKRLGYTNDDELSKDYAKFQDDIMTKYRSDKVDEQTGNTPIQQWMQDNKKPKWGGLTDTEKSEYGSPYAYQSAMRIEAYDSKLLGSPKWGSFHRDFNNAISPDQGPPEPDEIEEYEQVMQDQREADEVAALDTRMNPYERPLDTSRRARTGGGNGTSQPNIPSRTDPWTGGRQVKSFFEKLREKNRKHKEALSNR